jgi:hypothetical protein
MNAVKQKIRQTLIKALDPNSLENLTRIGTGYVTRSEPEPTIAL